MKTLSGLTVEAKSRIFASVTAASTFLQHNSINFISPIDGVSNGACVAAKIEVGVFGENEKWFVYECQKGAIICISFKNEDEDCFFRQMTDDQYSEIIESLSVF